MPAVSEADRAALLNQRGEARQAAEGAAQAHAAFVESVRALKVAGHTNQEIGDVLGVTRQRISQLLKED